VHERATGKHILIRASRGAISPQIPLEIEKEVENKIIVTIGQLLKLAPDLNTYLTTFSKQSTPSEGNTSKATITVITTTNHHMAIIVVHVKKKW